MSVEQYLSLNEDDIQYMISINCGSTASSPWCGSAVKKVTRTRWTDEDIDPEDEEGLDDEERDLDEETYESQMDDPEAPESE